MHPIERLRFVARAEGIPGQVLAAEAARALVSFADEPAALTAACRRVVSRQVACGPLWWLCARLLTAEDVRDAARDAIARLESDTTLAEVALVGAGAAMADDAADRTGPPVGLVTASAMGAGAAMVEPANLWACGDGEMWLLGGVGVHLADPLWNAAVSHLSATPRPDVEVVSLARFSHVIGPDGAVATERLGAPDCPVAPELLRLVG